jgi:glucosamine kinase
MLAVRDAAESNRKLSQSNLVVAVDTGGTKTAAWLVDSTGPDSYRLLSHARTSAGNPLSVGFDRAKQAIQDAITVARKEAQLPNEPAARAVLSIAGAANRDMAERFIVWARKIGLAEKVAIVSDVLPILAAGSPDCCGVALISGTGSSAFGRAADGRSKRCGGWGYLLGDEGSGYAIGRAALQNTLRSIEEGTPRQGLTDAVLTTINVRSVTELTRTIYGDAHPRHAIAALSALVTTAADKGDADATQILDAAAIDLAKLVSRTIHSVGLPETGCSLAVSGGVLINSKRLQDLLRKELQSLELDCVLKVVSEPLEGCVRLADDRFADSLVTWHSA